MSTTTATDVTAWTPDAETPPVTRVDEPRVAAFVAAHRLEEWVELAIRLQCESFPRATEITVSMYGTPDDEEFGERLFVEATTGVGLSESLKQDAAGLRQWTTATPPWVRERMTFSFKSS